MITIFITTVSSFAAGIPSQQVRNSHFVVNQPNFLDYVESCAIWSTDFSARNQLDVLEVIG